MDLPAHALSASGLSSLLERGEASSVELTRAHLDRAEAVTPASLPHSPRGLVARTLWPPPTERGAGGRVEHGRARATLR